MTQDGGTPLIDVTDPRDRSDRDTDRDAHARARSAEIDEVLMRLVHRVLQEVQGGRAAQARGEPPDPAAPLDRMIDVLDDLIDARRDLDRLYGAINDDALAPADVIDEEA